MSKRMHLYVMAASVLVCVIGTGCTVHRLDFSTIRQPDLSDKMKVFDVFVGSWTWEAELENAAEADRHWSGTASWDWDLDGRVLRGTIASRSANAEFKSAGVWSWHPTRKQYVWWMFNNWGFPQSGTAHVSSDGRCWRMKYRSVGLDGTPSYGEYRMQVVDHNTLNWSAVEWADPLHLIKKMDMSGTYTRVK